MRRSAWSFGLILLAMSAAHTAAQSAESPEGAPDPPAPEAEAEVTTDADPSDPSQDPVPDEAQGTAEVDASPATEQAAVQDAAATLDEAAPDEVAGQSLPSVSDLLADASHVRASVSVGSSSPGGSAGTTTPGVGVSLTLGEDEEARLALAPVRLPEAPLPNPFWLLPSAGPGHGPQEPPAAAEAPEAALVEAASARGSGLEAQPITLTLAAAIVATTLAVGAGTSSGSAGLAGWKRLLARLLPATLAVGLFSRLSEEALLAHPRRREIYDYVRQNPGERLEVVRRALGLPNGAMLHHVRILDQRNLVRAVRAASMTRLFPAGPRIQAAPYVLPIRRRVLDELRLTPGVTQRELARSMGLSERVVSYHVGWLAHNGLLAVQRQGASKRCFAAAPVPATAGPAPPIPAPAGPP